MRHAYGSRRWIGHKHLCHITVARRPIYHNSCPAAEGGVPVDRRLCQIGGEEVSGSQNGSAWRPIRSNTERFVGAAGISTISNEVSDLMSTSINISSLLLDRPPVQLHDGLHPVRRLSVCLHLPLIQERNTPNCSKLASRLPCWPVSTSEVKSRGQNFTWSIHRCLLVVCAIGAYDSRSVFSLSFSSTSLLFSALLLPFTSLVSFLLFPLLFTFHFSSSCFPYPSLEPTPTHSRPVGYLQCVMYTVVQKTSPIISWITQPKMNRF